MSSARIIPLGTSTPVPKFGQIPPPFEKVEGGFVPWLIKEGIRIVRYDLRSMNQFGRPLLVIRGAFISDRYVRG